MATIEDLKATFEKALASDHAAHETIVQEVIGDAKVLGDDFETTWPKAAPILTAVANFVRFIPGLGASAPVINALVAVGNAIYNADKPSSEVS
ncbi:MAG: hypothetical protein AAGG45_04580 [Pseudomonadota bacterium]